MCVLMVVFLQGDSTVVGTSKLRDLYERFEEELARRQERAKATRPEWQPPKTKLDDDPGSIPIPDTTPTTALWEGGTPWWPQTITTIS